MLKLRLNVNYVFAGHSRYSLRWLRRFALRGRQSGCLERSLPHGASQHQRHAIRHERVVPGTAGGTRGPAEMRQLSDAVIIDQQRFVKRFMPSCASLTPIPVFFLSK